MKLTTFLYDSGDYSFLKNSPFSEFVVATKEFSSLGKMSANDANSLIEKIAADGKKTVLLIDRLTTQSEFLTLIEDLTLFLSGSGVKTVRVQDIGIYQFILTHYPQLKIQLDLKTGHHNIYSLMGWLAYGKERVEKIVLSKEFSQETILRYSKELPTDIEIYAFGRIQLFHSPRSLLKREERDYFSAEGEMWASAKSEESPHQGFRIMENNRGTFMFHPRMLCLLDYLDDLKKVVNLSLSIDFSPSLSCDVVTLFSLFWSDPKNENLSNLKAKMGNSFIRGFYLGNKTDALIEKLKVPMNYREDPNFIGEVLEVHKNRAIAVKIIQNSEKLKLNSQLIFETPEGRKQKLNVKEIRDINLNPIDTLKKDAIIYLKYVRGVVPRTIVFLNSSQDLEVHNECKI